MTQDADCVRLFEATVRTSAPLDVLVNAADISKMVPHAQLHAHAARGVAAGQACWPADDGERRGALVRHQR